MSEFDPVWLNEIIGIHYRVWSFVEYGLFRAFSRAQREALSDTLGNALCFEAVDRIRHAQATVLYLMELEARVEGFKDHASKDHWLNDPVYQPLRRLVESLMATDDWAEIAFAVNLVIDPIATEVGVSRLVRHHGPAHGDPTTPMIIFTTERDRRRNQAWTEELVRMTTAPDLPSLENNRIVIRSWIERWTPMATAAAKADAALWRAIRDCMRAHGWRSPRAARMTTVPDAQLPAQGRSLRAVRR